jgi:hypothetical protein
LEATNVCRYTALEIGEVRGCRFPDKQKGVTKVEQNMNKELLTMTVKDIE